jgi:hypothetical protein
MCQISVAYLDLSTRKASSHEIWLLALYSKSEQSTIPGHMLKQIAEAIKNE